MRKKWDILPDDESLTKEFPLLHSISKENPFSVPENYFDSLPSEILEKCSSRDIIYDVPGRWAVGTSYMMSLLTSLLGYKWRLLTVAGCVAIICIFASRLNDRPVSYAAMAQAIPDSLIVKHFDNNITDINISILEELSEGIPLEKKPENSAATLKSKSDSANTDQQIIAYLLDNNVSVSEIENEL